MQCANCGQELTPGGVFCGNCGAKLIAPAPPQSSQTPVPANNSEAAPNTSLPQSSPAPASPIAAEQPATNFSNTSSDAAFQNSTTPATASNTPSVNPAAPPPAQMSPAPQPIYVQQHAYAVPKSENHGLSIASMVIGIASLLMFWFPFLGTILAVLALVFGFIGIGKGAKGMAIAGLITGGIGFILSIVFLVFIFAISPDYSEEPSSSQTTSGSDLQFSNE